MEMTKWLTALARDPALRAAAKALLVALIGAAAAALDVQFLDGQLGPAVGRAVLAPFA